MASHGVTGDSGDDAVGGVFVESAPDSVVLSCFTTGEENSFRHIRRPDPLLVCCGDIAPPRGFPADSTR